MASKGLQDLLRFLSQDAKTPLATAMGKIKELQNASLMSPEAISKVDLKTIQAIFQDEKLAKQIHNAAKRVSKKRLAPEKDQSTSPSKRGKKGSAVPDIPQSDAELENSLALPTSNLSAEELSEVVLFTNRAPLVLAFAVVLLKYTMPNQPVSSRLSLAQAYVSISSRSRAVSLGIEKGASAEEEGWGAGQPTVTVMGKEIRVMRRSGYDLTATKEPPNTEQTEDTLTQETLKDDRDEHAESEPPLWGLDLEALRSSNLSSAQRSNKSSNMPIYTPQSARSYLLKVAGSIPRGGEGNKKQSAAAKAEETERNLGMLLRAIDMVYESWLPHIGTRGLDNRTWGWYAQVRPDIASGKQGWGAKNEVKLKNILDLVKKD